VLAGVAIRSVAATLVEDRRSPKRPTVNMAFISDAVRAVSYVDLSEFDAQTNSENCPRAADQLTPLQTPAVEEPSA